MNDACIVLCTVADYPTATRLAEGAVQQRLAACVNVLPGVTSVYEWQGQIEQAQECQLVFKTVLSKEPALQHWVKQQHPYDEPEWLVLAVTQGSDSYLRWLQSCVR